MEISINQVVSQDWVPLWTALSANAAIVTALVTAAYTYFTLRLVRSQNEPKVIMYVKHYLNRPSILMIVVENIGRDIAHDVKFFPQNKSLQKLGELSWRTQFKQQQWIVGLAMPVGPN